MRPALAAQVTQVVCDRAGPHRVCGIVLQGVKFKRTLDRRGFTGEVAALIEGAFRAVPDLEEVDAWATVPLDAGKGVVVSGDYAKPTSATVFSITVPRARRMQTPRRLAGPDPGVFWDPAFAASLAKGSRG